MTNGVASQSRIPFSLIPLILFFGIMGVIGAYSAIVDPIPRIAGQDNSFNAFDVSLFVKKIFPIFYMIPALGFILRKIWVQQIAVAILAIDLVFSLLMAFWALAIFSPPIISYTGFPLIILWYYLWIFLVRRESVKDALI